MPAPNSGNGFFDTREVVLAPTVWLCCRRCVCIRSTCVGCRERASVVAVAARSAETDEDDEDDDELA